MSELIQKNDSRATIRWKLLTGASALALTAYVSSAGFVYADDSDHPLIWIELGGQAEAVSGQGQSFTAPFLTTYASSPVLGPTSPLDVEKPPRYSFGGEASVSFQPEDSNWIFSAGIRYGRSNNRRNYYQQTSGHHIPTTSAVYQFFLHYYGSHLTYLAPAPDYSDTKARHSENHTILDFQAGKDVGLGMLGANSSSVISGGVRMVRFNSSASADIHARPDAKVFFPTAFPKYYFTFHHFHLSGDSQRGFHGIGPSLSWSASVPLAGNPKDGELSFDWGLNASILFGKQTAQIHHHTSGRYQDGKYHSRNTSYNNPPVSKTRSRNVTVPNVGGSVGISYQFTDAKLSLGYRYDTFIGAMDTGIDTVKKSAMTFNGPYASISFGLGD